MSAYVIMNMFFTCHVLGMLTIAAVFFVVHGLGLRRVEWLSTLRASVISIWGVWLLWIALGTVVSVRHQFDDAARYWCQSWYVRGEDAKISHPEVSTCQWSFIQAESVCLCLLLYVHRRYAIVWVCVGF